VEETWTEVVEKEHLWDGGGRKNREESSSFVSFLKQQRKVVWTV